MLYIILGLVTLIYLLVNLVIPSTFEGNLGTYVVRPSLFILLGIIVYFVSKHEGLRIWKFNKTRRLGFGRNPFEAGLLIAGFQISLLVIAGILLGFGLSPFSHTPMFLIINFVFVFSPLIALELTRSYLIKKGTTRSRKINIVLGTVTIFFVLIMISPNQFLSLNIQNPAAIAKFIGKTLIPSFALSLFASYLVYLGGALASIGYVGALQTFEWFSPVLPDLDWGVAAIIGTLAPAVGYLIIQNSIQMSQRSPSGRKIKQKKKDPSLTWVGVAAICVIIVFFSTGMLGVQSSVIYSGSMRPTMDVGDIAVVSDIELTDIQIGDIIQYEKENMAIPIIHRVEDIQEEDGNQYFITKGDANKNPDPDPVPGRNIRGKVIFNIPKIGWISIFIKDLIQKIT